MGRLKRVSSSVWTSRTICFAGRDELVRTWISRMSSASVWKLAAAASGLPAVGLRQGPGAEILDRERGHGGSARERLSERVPVVAAAAREPADEAPRE